MRILPISSLWSVNNINKTRNYVQNPISNNNSSKDVFVKSPDVQTVPYSTLSFMGYDIHIIDGGAEGEDLRHFAESVSKDLDVEVHLHRPEDVKGANNNKLLQNVEIQLNQLSDSVDENSYVAIPVKMTVSLQNLAEQYKQVMGYYLHLKPHSTKTCQAKLLDFLSVLYYNPDKYRKYIDYMDPNGLGLEYAYGIIRAINSLKCKKVYVAADNPHDETLNWLAGERGEKPELTNYLATGYDSDNKVNNMLNFIKGKEWYDFNVLALSNAQIVNLKKADGYSDHIKSSYDTTVNSGARGVYNLYPIRQRDDKIIGYSFHDTDTIEYPAEDFSHAEETKDIDKFVGLSVYEVVADDERTEEFKHAIKNNQDTSSFSDKLYPVWKLFTQQEIWDNKLNYKGDFVDSSLKHYFRRNSDYKIIYPEADCENSGRPSVRSMIGSCYSIFNVIKNDVENHQFYDNIKDDSRINLDNATYNYYAEATAEFNSGQYSKAEKSISRAIEYMNLAGFERRDPHHMRAYEMLADIKFINGDYSGANGLYNFYLNNLCKNYVDDYKSLPYAETKDVREHIVEIFGKLADIAHLRHEDGPEYECRRALYEIAQGSKMANQVLERRANDDINIGDIFG